MTEHGLKTNLPEMTGIYPGIPMEQYLAHDAVSNSDLGNMARSPEYAHLCKTEPGEKTDTPATLLGTAIHTAILEPERFETEYTLDPTDEDGGYRAGWRNTKAYKAAKADIRAHGHEVLAQRDLDACRWIQDNVAASWIGREILAIKDDVEVSVLASDPEYDLVRKIRPDVVVSAASMLVDIKKTRDIRPGPFSRDCVTFGYHRTAPWYLDTANLAWDDAPFKHYLFLVIADTAPHEIRGYTLPGEAIEHGRQQYATLLDRWAKCATEGKWPGGSGEIEELALPPYVYTQEI